MAGDPFGLLLRQRIVFLGGEARAFSVVVYHICKFACALNNMVTVKVCFAGK